MQLDNNTRAFFELVKAGLWEKEAGLSKFNGIDFNEVLRVAEEQSVLGLVTAGLEFVTDTKIPKDVLLQFIGQTMQLERRNKAMNAFIAELVAKLREQGIYTLLVKGQGVAQCYERPTWRACGDVDFLLSKDNYEKAKTFLSSIAFEIDDEDIYSQRYRFRLCEADMKQVVVLPQQSNYYG